ncbi:MAG: 6-phosphogluconolactonase [Polaromonas sp.]|nr:6-phosphogluconolactonase [Polaromonas sp.]
MSAGTSAANTAQLELLARRIVHMIPSASINAELAQDIAQRLDAAIAERGFAVLSVSGGKSPIPLFEALRREPLDWSKVRVTLVDERCVPCTHPDSNALLVRTHLLQENASAASFVPMVEQAAEALPAPAVLAQAASLALQAAGRTDMLVLGMGADGHTASLFPDALNLADALDLNNPQACMAIELANPPANAPFQRLTQPLAQLLRARHIVLPLSGADKLATLRLAQQGINPTYPISCVLHQTETPVALWITS